MFFKEEGDYMSNFEVASNNSGEEFYPQEPKVYEAQPDSAEFLKCQTGFQASIIEYLTNENVKKVEEELRSAGKSDDEIGKKKIEVANAAMMDFLDNHAAAYKYLLKKDSSQSVEIIRLEKQNPGPSKKNTETAEEYAQKKELYDATKEERMSLAESIIQELNSQKMTIINGVLEQLKVGRKLEKGGILPAEFMDFCDPAFEKMYTENPQSLKEAVANQKVAEFFSKQIAAIKENRRLVEESRASKAA
jgi:hypothetical protein